MWVTLREYHRPDTISAALKILARESPRTVPLAGGTHLVAMRDPSIQAVVDLSSLGMNFINSRGNHLRLGAMTTLQTLATHPTVRQFTGGLLAEAAKRSATRAIRNLATLGGLLVTGDSTSELALALLALDAQIVIRSPQRRTVEAATFFNNLQGCLSPWGLIVEVCIPKIEKGNGTALNEVSCTKRDRPIVNAATLIILQGEIIRMTRLALGGVTPAPIRLPAVETILSGCVLDDALIYQIAEKVTASVDPPSDNRSTAEFRRAIAGIIVSRSLQQAYNNALSQTIEQTGND